MDKILESFFLIKNKKEIIFFLNLSDSFNLIVLYQEADIVISIAIYNCIIICNFISRYIVITLWHYGEKTKCFTY